MTRSIRPWLAFAILLASPFGCGPSRLARDPAAVADPAPRMDAYSLDTCAVCRGRLGVRGDSPDISFDGRSLRVCCTACADAFNSDPRAAIARLDAVMIEDQRPHYPGGASLVSGRPLGPNPVEFIWGNRLFRVADERDRDAILADPARWIRELDRRVIAEQTPTYGMPDRCPVQGDILPSDTPIDIVVANRMIRVCCARCVRSVRSHPSQYLSMVDYANRHPRP